GVAAALPRGAADGRDVQRPGGSLPPPRSRPRHRRRRGARGLTSREEPTVPPADLPPSGSAQRPQRLEDRLKRPDKSGLPWDPLRYAQSEKSWVNISSYPPARYTPIPTHLKSGFSRLARWSGLASSDS